MRLIKFINLKDGLPKRWLVVRVWDYGFVTLIAPIPLAYLLRFPFWIGDRYLNLLQKIMDYGVWKFSRRKK